MGNSDGFSLGKFKISKTRKLQLLVCEICSFHCWWHFLKTVEMHIGRYVMGYFFLSSLASVVAMKNAPFPKIYRRLARGKICLNHMKI